MHNENFYIIDIESLENLTLNYGKGYEKEKTDKLSQETDIYVVNEKSHNIYYIKGDCKPFLLFSEYFFTCLLTVATI